MISRCWMLILCIFGDEIREDIKVLPILQVGSPVNRYTFTSKSFGVVIEVQILDVTRHPWNLRCVELRSLSITAMHSPELALMRPHPSYPQPAARLPAPPPGGDRCDI